MVIQDVDLIKICGGTAAIVRLFNKIVNTGQIIKIKILLIFLFR